MGGNDSISGYLDVKISARSRRGFTPWKAWQKQWCEIRRLDSIENGVELKLKSSADGGILRSVVLPRSSTICRTESRTKQHAFGVFTLGRNQKPLLFLSGSSEDNSQTWISSIRRMLSVASYLPVGDTNFHVSLVDNAHSRSAGLVGLFGVLGTNAQEIIISDPCTGEQKISWKWYQFHHFHFQAPTLPADEQKICVMHTSGDFPSGPGHLYLYSKQAPRLLDRLVSRGKHSSPSSGLMMCKRLSCSEGNLCDPHLKDLPDSPLCFRSQTGSDDSGVRASLTSDDSDIHPGNKNAASLFSLGMALMTTTPGGSETNDSMQDLTCIGDATDKCSFSRPLSRRESGISLASGIYEEIPETPPKSAAHVNHIYENPIDIILQDHSKSGRHFKPPPLPPRQNEMSQFCDTKDCNNRRERLIPFKQRCNTLPAKDLARISQTFTSDSEYMVMSPRRNTEKNVDRTFSSENLYMPMTPLLSSNAKTNIENCYMAMNGKNLE